MSGWAPGELPTLAVLAFILAVLAGMGGSAADLAFHGGMLAAYWGVCRWARSSEAHAAWPARCVATVAVLHGLYLTTGNLGLELITRRYDGWLMAWDTVAFGRSPALAAAQRLGNRGFEGCCAVYAGFVPFIYSAIAAGCLSGREKDRERFLSGLAWVYAVSLPWHFLYPAQGPRVFEPEVYAVFSDSGRIHALVRWCIDRAGGPHGAFPSLHAAATLYCCFFELRARPRLGLAYAPLAVAIAAACVATGYHYAVDVAAGAAAAGLGWFAAYRVGRPEAPTGAAG